MATEFKRSEVCCSTPAIIGPPYEPKGQWFEIDNKKLYTTGSLSATKAIFIIYDIFGYSYQILEGADYLASQGYRVFMPDFFSGQPAPLKWMPLPGADGIEPPQDMESVDSFAEERGNTDKTVALTLHLHGELQKRNPTIEKWGLIGYCWGGWVANFLIGPTTPFKAAVQCHAGWPERGVAEKVTVPLLALCSKDEPEKEYAQFKPYLKVDSRFEQFPTMLHGWLASRADLSRDEVRKDYDRGYAMIAEWFQKYL